MALNKSLEFMWNIQLIFYVIIFDASGLHDIMLFHTMCSEIIPITQKLYILAESFAKKCKKKPLICMAMKVLYPLNVSV